MIPPQNRRGIQNLGKFIELSPTPGKKFVQKIPKGKYKSRNRICFLYKLHMLSRGLIWTRKEIFLRSH
jgi:hypothetical protein